MDYSFASKAAPRRAFALLFALAAPLSACDGKEDPVANEDRDLEGEPCNFMGGSDPEYRACAGGEGEQMCKQWSDEVDGSWGACWLGGECRPGDTMATEPPPATDGDEDFDPCAGVPLECEVDSEGQGYWFLNCDTPLVLRFDTATPVEFAPRPETMSADFAIAAGSCTSADWPTAATPWLVRDLNGDGQISGGHELFGSGTELTGGRFATNGFEALRALNSDGNDRFDANDSAYAELALWADHDGDRRVGPGELQTLAEAGVVALSLQDEVDVRCDARGNCGKERAAFEFAAGSGPAMHSQVGEVVDVYLPCR